MLWQEEKLQVHHGGDFKMLLENYAILSPELEICPICRQVMRLRKASLLPENKTVTFCHRSLRQCVKGNLGHASSRLRLSAERIRQFFSAQNVNKV